MTKLMMVIGTRPELIKVAPLAIELNKRQLKDQYIIVNTAQHKDLLDPYWKIFGLEPNYVLDLMVPGQSLSALTGRALVQLQEFLSELKEQNRLPEYILAQGDTTTVMTSSMVAFYNKIRFCHLEAGLRSFDLQHPYPEEYNRKIAAIAAHYHFTPTAEAKENLINEGIEESKVLKVGNTVIDALNYISSQPEFKNPVFENEQLNVGLTPGKNALITCHRRENHGENLKTIISAINDLAEKHDDFHFVWPVHPNPNVKNVVLQSQLSKKSNVILTSPLNYFDLLKLLGMTAVAISDSGGIQEEAPSFQVPVVVLREKTERPEGVNMGLAKLVGADYAKITEWFENFLNDNPVKGVNPYGDGLSAKRVIDAIWS
ncbi:MAG: UDP-N-acetylglucosamine 2-epimerase (non-hydrolyzing) [Bacteroidota bacterium]